MLIGLTGKKQHGKDTAAAALVADGWVKIAFADPMRDAMYALDPIVDGLGPWHYREALQEYGYDWAKELFPEIRRLMQCLGTEVGRAQFGESFWIDQARSRIEDELLAGRDVVVTDVRFPNELRAIRDMGGRVLRVHRPDAAPTGDVHPSETALDGHSLPVLLNVGSVGDLHYLVRREVQAIRGAR